MLNGRFKCVASEAHRCMMEGKTYTFTNGYFTREDGTESCPYNSMLDFNTRNAMWVEIEPCKEPRPFTKADIKSGMCVKMANGQKYMAVVGDMMSPQGKQETVIFMSHDGYLVGSDYNDDLTHKDDYTQNKWDIVEVTEGCVYTLVGTINDSKNVLHKVDEHATERRKIEKQIESLQNRLKELQ